MTHSITPYLIILIAPLAAFCVQVFFGARLPRKGDWVSTLAIFASLVASLSVAPNLILHGEKARFSVEWFALGPLAPSFQVRVGLFADALTGVMLCIVTLISFLVHLYSLGYMHGDKRYSRYFAYLSLFSFSMLGLVLVDNFLSIYIFWELVGLGSYLLIGHWFERPAAANASKKAFLTTRVGDVGMFIGILILYFHLGDFNFESVFSTIAASGGTLGGSHTALTVAGILIFMGAVGKSAQFPLHVWLPDAMEGPTTVSALIHAATMVAAGVYLVGRVFLMFTAEALLVIAYIGAITAFMGAFIALTQKDIKRILAYSTISQLGFMMLALGVGAYTAGLFHLMTHAFFKGLLFLCSGSVIHALGTQNIFEMGGLRRKMPITCWTMTIGAMAISGVPFLSGFYSKDAILAGVLDFGLSSIHMALPIIAFITAGMTAFYMFR